MGWNPFKSKTKIHVASQAFRIMDDSVITDSAEQVVIDVLLKKKDFGEAFRHKVFNGNYMKFRQFLRYGETKYARGLPTAELDSNNLNVTEITNVLTAAAGKPVTVVYAHFTKFNPYHVAWGELVNTYGYSFTTNQLESLEATYGSPVYLDRMELVYPTTQQDEFVNAVHLAFADTTAGLPVPGRIVPNLIPNLQPIFAAIPDPYVDLYLVYETQDEVTFIKTQHTIVRRVNLTGFNTSKNYYHVKYRTTSGTFFWTYDPETGYYPSLDGETSNQLVYTQPGRYYPIVLIRSGDADMTAEHLRETDTFKTSEAMLRKIGLNLLELSESIHSNPDAEDIQQAAIELSVPLNTDDPLLIEYLYRYFDSFHERITQYKTTIGKPDYDPFSAFTLSFKEASDYSFAITITDIFKKSIAGSVGEVGSFTSSSKEVELRIGRFTFKKPAKVFRHQVFANLYQEVTVVGIERSQLVYSNKSDVADFTEDACLIPVDQNVVLEFRNSDRDILLSKSLHIVINSMQKQKIEWYQTEDFAIFLQVVAVAIIIFTAGTATGPVAATLAALGATGTTLLVLTVLIEMYLLQMAVDIAARYVSPEFALVLAIVAAVISFGANSEGLFSAANLVRASNGLFQVSALAYQNEYGEVMKDYEAEMQRQDAMWEEMEEVRKLLDPNILIDPFVFIGMTPHIKLGEEPEDYYARTIHSGNIGRMAYEQLHTYYDMKKKLPTPQDTMTI